MASRRIYSLDLLRGGGILVILIIHRLHYHWTGMSGKEAVRAHLAGPLKPFVILTIALFTMAGVFYFVTGFVNAYALSNRLRAGSSRLAAIRGSIVAGAWLIVLNYAHRIFLMNGFMSQPGEEPTRFPAGLLTGRIRYGYSMPFRWSMITEPGTLALIGWILIIVSALLAWAYTKQGDGRAPLRLGRRFVTLAALVLVTSPVLRVFLRPAYESALQSGKILRATLFGLLSDEFGLFPYLAFGLAGAVLGVYVAAGLDLKAIRKRAAWGSLALFLVALLALIASDRHSELGRRISGVAVSAAELSLFIIFWVILSKIFDDGEKSDRRREGWLMKGIARFGAVALTVYILEPAVAETLARALRLWFGPHWLDSYFLVLAFGLLNVALWWALLALWERHRFFASLEWLSVQLLRAIGKKESHKLEPAS